MKKRNYLRLIICSCTVISTSFIACASSESYSSYYSMTNTISSRIHTASATPTCTITTSNMSGESDIDLWVELDKKNAFGYYAAPGRSDDKYYTTVPSTYGTTFSLLGNGAGSYKIYFKKCRSSNKEWYSDLDISYNK